MTETLTDPGLPIMLTLSATADGQVRVNYLCQPQDAVDLLRSTADSIEKEQQAKQEEGQEA